MAGVEHMAGIDEKLLAKLGKEGLGNHDNVPKLGQELEFKPTEISLYIETNHSGGHVGTKGTVNLLFDWKKNTRKAPQVSTLRAVLIMVGFEGLAEQYFPESSSHPTDDSSPDLPSTCTSSTPDLMVTASQPMPDLVSSTLSSSPNPGTALVADQTAKPTVDPASEQPQRGLHFCRMRRTSYTMDGFCLLYLLQILLMRSGDVETNPGPNPAVSTVSEMEFLKLAQAIPPSYYNAVGISLGIPIAQLENILIQKSNNSTDALLLVFTKWNVMQQPPHSNKRQLLADKLRDIDLGGLSDSILTEPLIPNSTEPLQGASSTQPQQASLRRTSLRSTSLRSTEETLENISGRQEDFDDKLKTVARIVVRRDEIDDLGKALGFYREDIQRYVDKNMRSLSYMGTISMLRQWRMKQTEATECEALKDVLMKARQIRLADELFGTS